MRVWHDRAAVLEHRAAAAAQLELVEQVEHLQLAEQLRRATTCSL